jgi:hypothetical protein
MVAFILDTMDFKKLPLDIKLAIYSFIIGFIISFLIGAIAKNPVGIISLRAFVSAVLFGVLIYAGLYLLRKYIPELEIVAPGRKTGVLKVDEAAEGETIKYTTLDEKKVSQHIKVEESNGIIGEEGIEKEDRIDKTQIFPEAEEDTGEEALPSLDKLFEDEETVPDLEIEKEVVKEDKRIIGDYINVGKVRIPNEPEVLAKAIKKVMSKDER